MDRFETCYLGQYEHVQSTELTTASDKALSNKKPQQRRITSNLYELKGRFQWPRDLRWTLGFRVCVRFSQKLRPTALFVAIILIISGLCPTDLQHVPLRVLEIPRIGYR
jgi:hypothetical protein